MTAEGVYLMIIYSLGWSYVCRKKVFWVHVRVSIASVEGLKYHMGIGLKDKEALVLE